MKFGEKWRSLPASYWDDMAERCADLPFNEALRREVLKSSSVIEIGCGAGHFARSFFDAGYRGTYWGCDIGRNAVHEARARLGPSAIVRRGQFETLSAMGMVPSAELAVSRSVVQHQEHWLPIVSAALKHAPRIVLGISRDIYFKETGEHEVRNRKTFFDVCISLEAVEREAREAGLVAQFERLEGPVGPEVVISVEKTRAHRNDRL